MTALTKRSSVNLLKSHHVSICKLSPLEKEWLPFSKNEQQDFFSLIYMEKGAVLIKVDGYELEFKNGGILLVKPESLFSITINKSSKGTILNFTKELIDLYELKHLVNEDFNLGRSFIYSTEKLNVLAQLIRMVNAELQLEYTSNSVLRQYVVLLLLETYRHCKVHNTTKQLTMRLNPILAQYQELINTHYLKLKLPSDYAPLLNISANYLNKICQSELNSTAGKLIRIRLYQEAMRLLQYTQLPIYQIAEQLGFETPSYFITFFKKENNQTPEQFRKTKNGSIN